MALVLVLLVLSAGRIFAANRLVEYSRQLQLLDEKITAMENENEALAQEVNGLGSLGNIMQSATKQGFTKTSGVSFVTHLPTVAFQNTQESSLR